MMKLRFGLAHRTNKVLWIAIVASVLVLTLLLGACSWSDNQAIEDTITDFITAYNNQEFSHCIESYSHRLRVNEGDSNLLQQLHDERAWDFNVSLKSMGEPQIGGTTAMVWIDYQTGLLQTVNTTQIYLIKENGRWKIDRAWK